MTRSDSSNVDVCILGGGLAGLTLARHLLLHTDRTVRVVEKRAELPPKRQKVGESSVQLAGYYYGKVLDLEDHLYFEHLMKYNLRFYWKTAGRRNDAFEDYSAAYIRNYSNIPSYQLDRNVFEAELIRRNAAFEDRYALDLGAEGLQVDLCEEGEDPHRVRYSVDGEARELRASWVVDATGRRRFLAKKRELTRDQPLDHGAFFWWVDGLVDIEKLTGQSNRERRLRPDRRHTGHLPAWLATNHFCDEGLWFWVIPLHGKTSLGLVFDNDVVHWRDVFNVEKATEWICERFPLFARDLPQRKVLDFGGYRSYAHDCGQTLSAQRWAVTGEAGRFNDPLYSPGSDLISIHNTLIVDAILARDPDDRKQRCRTHESLTKAVYQAYLPTYATSYDALGDVETFYLKYVWELAVYFAVYVFPFINDLFTERRFQIGYLRRFAKLGPWNRGVQGLLSGYFQWKKEHAEPSNDPAYLDFTEIETLARAADTFFEVGLDAVEARRVLDRQLENLEELARFTAVHVASVVLDDPDVLRSRAFAESLDLEALHFDPESMAEHWRATRDQPGEMEWSMCAKVLERFRHTRKRSAIAMVS
ncbi:MAG: hypothetical protein MPN21_14825 [Thermoanaerobaculia bacterium]|nr:hypothetical protein [Thermoanaerobaculia bacterium]